MLTNQLMDVNITSSDMVLDTRTPPRVRQQTRREKIEEPIENSHAGIAVPVDEDTIMLDEPTKKLHFYKIDKPTTDSGLSTWILLSGHTSSPTSTTKTARKPTIKQNQHDMKNITVVITDAANKILKPVFKKRPPGTITTKKVTTTFKPTTTITTAKPTTAKSKLTTAKPEKPIKLTKVKASILNNAKSNNLTLSTKTTTTTTKNPSTTTTSIAKTTTSKTVELVKVSDSNAIKSNALPIEAKNEEIDLESSSTTTQNPKKTRRPTNKRKKNKNRRKKPNDVSNTTETKVAVTNKEKPIGTQIYNYLSREVMPTVGVGLVGLMVTAGLASYFLYPFGTLRRSYDIDRKDKDSSHYYRNDYPGGIAEEDAIGKVIAGMPSFPNYNNYQSKNAFPITNVLNSNVRYRHVDHHRYSQPQASVETVKINPEFNKKEEVVVQNMYMPQETYNPHYSKEIMNEKNDDNKFVVGNVPKEYMDEVTPIAVPEHGPRNLKLKRRRRRQIDYKENDIFSDESLTFQSTLAPVTLPTTSKTTTKLTESTTNKVAVSVSQQTSSFLDLFKDILQLKIKMGLELLQNTTQTISRYISRIQKRVEEKTANS